MIVEKEITIIPKGAETELTPDLPAQKLKGKRTWFPKSKLKNLQPVSEWFCL